MFMGKELRNSLGLGDWKEERKQAVEALGRIGLEINPDVLIETLSVGQQQMVEVAKAIHSDAKLIIMDVYDTTVHFLDMARYLLGDICEIRALGAASFYPIEDGFAVQMKFKSGAYGVISSCGYASWISPFERVQVVGDHKSVITEELDSYRYSSALGAVVEGREFSTLEHDVKWGYAQMHDHMFNECIFGGAAPKNSVDDGYKVVELIEACYESARADGKIIRFDV